MSILRTLMARRAFISAAAAVLAFAIYLSNGQWNGTYDSAPNSVLTYSVLERGRLDLDEYRGSYFGPLGGQYAFVEGANGHLAPVFPIGSAIVAAPAYAVLYFFKKANGAPPNLTSPTFEPERRLDERVVAALIAAVTVGLFFLCALEIGTFFHAFLATTAFAFATPMWTIASQALWQHGPVNLGVLVCTYAIFRAHRPGASATTWIAIAGASAGFLPVIRPTAVLLSAAVAAYVLWQFRNHTVPFVVAFCAGIAPGVAWNLYFFHALSGGYSGNLGAYRFDLLPNVRALAGLLFSPSRGLFIFVPLCAFAVVGAVRAMRADARGRLPVFLGVACIALVLNYAFFEYWWGGLTYGPRFLTDVAAVACLLLIYILPAVQRSAPVAIALFGVALLYSAAVQAVGAFSGAAGADWNSVPFSVDAHPERLWAVHDNQIERNARAFYYKAFRWDVATSPPYLQGYGAQVRATTTHLQVRNVGRVPLYGYESGVYRGQTRVKIVRNDGSVTTGYVAQTLRPGSAAIVTGTDAVRNQRAANAVLLGVTQ